MTVDPAHTTVPATRDAGFTLPEVLIVIVLMGILAPVLAMAFSVVVRNSPTSEARADDSRSLTNLTNWISQDVSSTSEDGFFIGASSPDGGCVLPPSASSSVNLFELHWKEGTKQFVTNYRCVSNTPADGKGRIFRYACLRGELANELRMTAELNEVAASPLSPFAPAPVRITPVPTVRADKTPGVKGVQLVVIILDDYGVQRELLNLDATTTNVATLLADGTTGGVGTNTAPTAEKLSVSMMQGTTRLESLPATDPPSGDALFAEFEGVPPTWNLIATGTTVEIAPDPSAPPGLYSFVYRVTDPFGLSAAAPLDITITPISTNVPPIAQSAQVPAARSVESTKQLLYSDLDDPDEATLVVNLITGDIPAGWVASVDAAGFFRVTPSADAVTSVIRYTVTDPAGNSAMSQITVDVCALTSVKVTPQTVKVKGSGGLDEPVTVEIATNGACGPLVVGFLPNDTAPPVEVTESFNASNVVTISESTSYAWIRPAASIPRLVPLNIRQGANGPILQKIILETTR